MRAAVITEIGSPPRAQERPEPERGPGQAIVEVHAAALNPIEIRVAAGRFPRRAAPPYVPGLEGAGVVAEADNSKAGQRVRFEGGLPGFGVDGVLSELTAVPEESLVAIPEEVDDATAAAIGTVGITAWLALDRASVAPGERVLVLGATGAVGQMAVQLAKLHGAGCVVAAGREEGRLRRAQQLGADASVQIADATDAAQLAGAFREAAGGPLDVIVDPLWGRPAMAALAAAGTGARLVNVGEAAGTYVQVPLGSLRNNQAAIHALSSGWMPLEAKLAAFRRVLEHTAFGRLAVDLEVVPLGQIAEAWERQAGSPGRKLVIQTRGDG